MPETKDENNCPKENCGLPESTYRFKAGKKISICGKSHSWNAEEVAEQRRKSREAAEQEGLPPGFDAERYKRIIKESLRPVSR